MSPQKLLWSEPGQKQKDHCRRNMEHPSELLIDGAELDFELIVQKLMMLHVINSKPKLAVKATQ
jgi:hypothetical protein